MEIFDRLDVLPEMLHEGRTMEGFSFFLGDHRIGRLGFAGLDSPYPYVLLLPQSVTERILIERMERHGVVVERPVELVGLTQDASAVRATLRHRDGREEEVAASYLAGCDGGHSVTRKLLGLSFNGKPIEREYVIDVRVDWPQAYAEDDGVVSMSERSVMVCGRLPDDRWRVTITTQLDDLRVTPEAPTLAQIEPLMAEHPIFRDARMSDPIWSSSYTISSRKVDRLRHGRVFLAGDAAHIHSPMGGRGMNTGIQDAVNLGWKLALVQQGMGSQRLLDSYHAERYPVIQGLLRSTEMMARLILPRQAWVTRIRNLAQPGVLWIRRLQPWLAAQFSGFDASYHHSPIVHDVGWRRGVRAGDVAPDGTGTLAETGQLVQLSRLWAGDPRHHLLVFAGRTASQGRIEEENA
jgi:2-polyprenyl-6-methoxyphenol hydroxylase-like FAD-dependent oxidoreductase